ncbi:MAG: DUF3857 domain-containing protein, partial [Sphingobacteriaceae bacterium]|nr:DUF3857 domain-containing protein [Cytophagaceae bacterium]
MKFLLACLLWFCFVSGFAQKSLRPVSLADVTARTYPADTNAVAVVLSDYCDTRLDPSSGTGMVLQRKIRIKILQKAGYDWATVAIPFFSNGYQGKEFVQKINGQTFNTDATGALEVTPLRNQAVMEEKVGAGQYVKRFTLPNVREGSVIEYEYTYLSEFSYLNDWVFQHAIPVVRSEFRLLLGSDFQYQI